MNSVFGNSLWTGLSNLISDTKNNINIIVNNGNASYRDVIRLISKIMNIVSYKLKLEIKLK